MPQAITHILAPIVILALIRNYCIQKKKPFSLRYVVLAGLGGALPDIDHLAFILLYKTGIPLDHIHRTFTHSIFFPLIFLVAGLVIAHTPWNTSTFHKLKISLVCYALTFGILTHLALDYLIVGTIMPFYPLSNLQIGLDLINLLPPPINLTIIPLIEGIILVLWLIHLEFKNKLQNAI
ncbi:MAG TPA: metal-dependent hydrolase [Candidatus Nanoarchaeia archaeon]|nr:metal-dependent hydrolase [Candidatus Nanoarchaeia archaeon]